MLGSAGEAIDPSSLRHASRRKPSVPKAADARPQTADSSIDFVRRNVELSSLTPRTPVKVGSGVPKGAAPIAGVAAAVSSPSTEPRKSKHHGRVPPYLMDRKLELAATAAAHAAEKAPKECPPGTHVLPTKERTRLLGLIESGQAQVHAELDKMPFVIDTYGLRTKHEALRGQLQKLDAAHTAFSRSRVIVLDAADGNYADGNYPDAAPSVASVDETASEALEGVAGAAEEGAVVVDGEVLPTTVLAPAPTAAPIVDIV